MKSYTKKHNTWDPRRTFVHCGGFAPAAPRRVWNLVSGSISELLLSQPVPIIGLVGHYPTNDLISRRSILRRNENHFKGKPFQASPNIRYYPQFPRVIPVHRVSYPRVTEPYAMNLNSFNLHGLIESQ